MFIFLASSETYAYPSLNEIGGKPNFSMKNFAEKSLVTESLNENYFCILFRTLHMSFGTNVVCMSFCRNNPEKFSMQHHVFVSILLRYFWSPCFNYCLPNGSPKLSTLRLRIFGGPIKAPLKPPHTLQSTIVLKALIETLVCLETPVSRTAIRLIDVFECYIIFSCYKICCKIFACSGEREPGARRVWGRALREGNLPGRSEEGV